MSPNMHRLLKFALRYPGWHTCGRDSTRAMTALEARGYLHVQRYDSKALPQFRVALPAHVYDALVD
jgi:hypothetical protein